MNKTKDCYVKNISGGMIKIGRNANNRPIIILPLNACTVVSGDMLEDMDIKRAFNLGMLSMVTEEEVNRYDSAQKDKVTKFIPSKFENPMGSMTIKESIEYIHGIKSVEELENLITLEERDSVVDEIEKRVDDLEDKAENFEVD